MKKILLFASLIAFFALPKVNGQVVNDSFENWDNNIAYFSGFTFFPADTFPYSDPVTWTTTNALSGADTFGGRFLVTKSSTAHTGSFSARLTTDTLNTVGTLIGPKRLTIPGLLVNGRFPLDLQGNVLTGGTITPAALPGAGQPFTQRLAAIKGFYQYAPVFNDSTGAMDSCMVWATLKKGSTIVANAVFKSSATVSSYTAFSASFDYLSCEQPDTLVILISASVPTLGDILTGRTKLVPGSVLLVDDIAYDTLAAGFNFPPIARKDNANAVSNTAVSVDVLANDEDCDNQPLSVSSIVTGPLHGTASIASNQVVYTSTSGYSGLDSLLYQAADANGTANAWLRVVVGASGINETNAIHVSVYPVPASTQLNIQFENTGKTYAKVYDMIGNLVMSATITQNNTQVSIATLSSGFYGLQLTNDKNMVIARSNFTVAK